jgi:hypothetical protein
MLKVGPPKGGLTGMYQPAAPGIAAAESVFALIGAAAAAVSVAGGGDVVAPFKLTGSSAQSDPAQLVALEPGGATSAPLVPVAVPVIGTWTDGCAGSLLVMVSTALNFPLTVGAKVIFTLLELPCENVNGPVPIAENGAPEGPLTVPSSMPTPRFMILTFALA